ncbi:hypothetical protein [Kosakonia phage Kc304]|nr:hypothetical protein [Kosakonia phage Kc304]UYM28773.1 terminase large subunit [Serratia phage vB_SspM_LC53]
MKYLTPIYLTLMHAFSNRADNRLEELKDQKLYPISLMQEYCTLRIDAGRQSGKTEAVAQFTSEWLERGNSVVIISDTSKFAETTKKRIIDEHLKQQRHRYSAHELKRDIITVSIRNFLSGNCNKFRGISLSRVLFIIDEPIRLPEMYKFYSTYQKEVSTAVLRTTNELPLFFVIGLQ